MFFHLLPDQTWIFSGRILITEFGNDLMPESDAAFMWTGELGFSKRILIVPRFASHGVYVGTWGF